MAARLNYLLAVSVELKSRRVQGMYEYEFFQTCVYKHSSKWINVMEPDPGKHAFISLTSPNEAKSYVVLAIHKPLSPIP